jgi:hypothetical protein
VYSTLKDRILALPEQERNARRALYTQEEWDKSWELNAFDHQLPPLGDDWTSWTVVGGRRTGKTTAGRRWMQGKMSLPNAQGLVIIHHTNHLSTVSKQFWDDLIKAGEQGNWRMTQHDQTGAYELRHNVVGDNRVLEFTTEGRVMNNNGFLGPRTNCDYLWADEILDAPTVMQFYPLTKQFCFTEPTKLPEVTIVSQAGKPRVY